MQVPDVPPLFAEPLAFAATPVLYSLCSTAETGRVGAEAGLVAVAGAADCGAVGTGLGIVGTGLTTGAAATPTFAARRCEGRRRLEKSC
jgi:hypothetical protein